MTSAQNRPSHPNASNHPGDLGAALRTWRDRLRPEVVGLPAGRRRRSQGLRREELAMLAGVSSDYVTRLEQGRALNPSPQVLEALARTLQLDVDERDYLFRLAGQQPPGAERVSSHLTPGVQRLLRRLDESPVSVHDAAWNIVAWNHAWASLMGDPSALTGRDRNLLWRHFAAGAHTAGAHTAGAHTAGAHTAGAHTAGAHTAASDGDDRGDRGNRGASADDVHTSEAAAPPPYEVRIVRSAVETAAFEAGAVGDLRAAAGRYPGDDRLRSLITDLRRVSPRFRDLWESGVVGMHVADVKVVDHPQMGELRFDCDVLTVHGADLRVIVYSAEPGSETAEKLAMLRVIGLQRIGV